MTQRCTIQFNKYVCCQ